MSKSKDSAKSTREKAAAARAEQQASEKRRERTVRIIGAIGVVVVVALIIGLAVVVPRMSGGGDDGGTALPSPDPSLPVPSGVYGPDAEIPYGAPYGSAPDTAPQLALWEDFQCPACGSLEEINGEGIQSLAADGKVRLVYRPTAFLDKNLGGTSSAQAIAAWGCAIDQGKLIEYHNTVYANQPPEGEGYTTDMLVGFAEQSGISGVPLEQFNDCLTEGRYLGWAVNSTQAFYDAGISGTPAGFLNGTQIENTVLADQAALEKAVTEAAG